MIAAYRSLFGAYVRWRIRRGLDGVWVRGLESAEAVCQGRPVVLAATHVAWWDGMLLFPLDDALGRSGRVWMDADNLRRLSFFGPLGALPLDAGGPGALRRSIRGAQRWLDRPGRTLWVFPQGRQRPSWLRPLGLRPGAAWLASQLDAALIPVAFSYGFREAPVPAAAVSFGPPVEGEHLEAGLLQQLEATDRFLADGDPSFEPLLRGRVRGSEHGVGARLLARAVGHG